jgi:hypothetical protein
MFPLGVCIAAFLSVPMVAATSASAEEKKKAAPPVATVECNVCYWSVSGPVADMPLGRRLTQLMQIDTVSSPEMPGFVELGISPHSVEAMLQEMLSKYG